jgi:hypothetical protein
VRLIQAGADLSAEAPGSAHVARHAGACYALTGCPPPMGGPPEGFKCEPFGSLKPCITTPHESGEGPIRDATSDPRTHTQEARHTRVALHRQDILPPPLGEAGLRPASER